MKIRKWCKCKIPIVCGYGPLTCLSCYNIIFSNVMKLPKPLRHLKNLKNGKIPLE